MTRAHHIAFTGVILVIGILPVLVGWLSRPSLDAIAAAGSLEVGRVVTGSGRVVRVHVMIGDVFRPRSRRNDVGFDVVSYTCYMDPYYVYEPETATIQKVWVGNPLLYSAIRRSTQDSAEVVAFVRRLIDALERNRGAVLCHAEGAGDATCGGDRVTPHIWATEPGSVLGGSGIRYIAAIPLFDPESIIARFSPAESRRRLRGNMEAAVRELVHAGGRSGREMRTAGFAALGSTSHEGGDSPRFLGFSDGFLSIVHAIGQSNTAEHFDRAYLVAYEEHVGAFREESIDGLKDVAEYLSLHKYLSFPSGGMAWIFVALLWVAAVWWPLKYERPKDTAVSVGDIAAALGLAAFCATVTVGLLSYLLAHDGLHPRSYRWVYAVHIVLTGTIGFVLGRNSRARRRRMEQIRRRDAIRRRYGISGGGAPRPRPPQQSIWESIWKWIRRRRQ